MAEFEMFRSFHIDNGELDDLRRNECFVLGYELGQVDELLNHHPQAFSKYIHANNQDRVKQACEQSGRKFALTWMSNDSSETWMWLQVEAQDAT